MSPNDQNDVRTYKVDADDDGIRLDRWFKRHLPQIGFATVSRWARTGQVRVDGGRAKPEDRIAAGQEIRVPPGGRDPKRKGPRRVELTEDEKSQAQDMVIHRDRAAIVLNKPPGLATQGGTGMTKHVDRLLDAYRDEEDDPRPRLVHRLDKDTSGVLLIAATPGSASYFSRRFSGRSATKVYWALVVGVPEEKEGMIDAPLAKQPGSHGEKMHHDPEGQPAKTRYRVIERAGNKAAWVELHPLTGRTHQLRAHMEAIGHPIVGDGKYGGSDAMLTGQVSRKMHLHARRLIIDHPGRKEKLDVVAPLPDHFAQTMTSLGFDLSLGEEIMDWSPPAPTKETKKAKARAHAKQYRKARRGERRSRVTSNPVKKKKPARGKPGAKGPKGKGPANKGRR
ncbi:RluA family pseudouridine synthase [Pseudoblastomonas halimionae]|uniref:Pseudouridine synthase n=1 Tax=Alteriqipengyuania halimionae TaxID=1926630 RepID=A0A6I4U4C9_9SPHN|nr:RluA family pseudouridine synthase [Alteriqipengyuania halimionae]MXP10214.1 RluA family pseudouridine synthase [Alteriqipengyuania halimionae]